LIAESIRSIGFHDDAQLKPFKLLFVFKSCLLSNSGLFSNVNLDGIVVGHLRNATVWIADWRWNTSEDVLVNRSDTLVDPDPSPVPALVTDADTIPGTPSTVPDTQSTLADTEVDSDVGDSVGDVEKQTHVPVIAATGRCLYIVHFVFAICLGCFLCSCFHDSTHGAHCELN
jgi:hypothetical protein